MNLTLTDELRQAVAQSELPVEVQDEQTKRKYYLISVEQFERVKELLSMAQVDPSLYEFTDEVSHW